MGMYEEIEILVSVSHGYFTITCLKPYHVITALERMTYNMHGSQWSPKRALSQADGVSKLTYLCHWLHIHGPWKKTEKKSWKLILTQ